jgi:hypothetical protein
MDADAVLFISAVPYPSAVRLLRTLPSVMAKKKRAKKKKDVRSVVLGAKRAEQMAQGALDGRFREKVVKNKKRYSRKRKEDPDVD